MRQWLDDVNVVEVGSSPSVKFCGRILAELGAKVIDVSAEKSEQLSESTYRFLRLHKNLVAAGNMSQLKAITGISQFDIVIGDSEASLAPFDDDPARPLLRGVVDAFGASGPWRDWAGSEVVYSSLGGAAGYTFSPSGTPVYGIGHRYQFLAGMFLYTGLMALMHRIGRQPSLPTSQRQVRVSVYELVVATMPYLPVQYFYNGSNRIDNHTGPRFVVRCLDGWVMTYLGPVWRTAAGMLEQEALIDDSRFSNTAAQFDNIAALEKLVEQWGARKTVTQTIEAARKWDIAVTEILGVDAVMDQVQCGHCGEWSDTGEALLPAFPVVVRNGGLAS